MHSEVLAILPTDAAAPERDLARLDAAERSIYLERSSPKRRLRWLAGRVVGKYLALEHLALEHLALEKGVLEQGVLEQGARKLVAKGQNGSSLPAKDGPRVLSPWQLTQFADDHYRALGTVDESSRAPTLSFRTGESEQRLPLCLSLSHAASCTVACLSTQRLSGVDLEAVAPWPETFRRQYFRHRERQWANRRDALGVDGRFTLLWTIKEAIFKALSRTRADVRTLWDLARFEIELPEHGFEALVPEPWQTGRKLLLESRVRIDHDPPRPFEAHVRVLRSPVGASLLILSAVTLLDAEPASAADGTATSHPRTISWSRPTSETPHVRPSLV